MSRYQFMAVALPVTRRIALNVKDCPGDWNCNIYMELALTRDEARDLVRELQSAEAAFQAAEAMSAPEEAGQ